LLDFAESSKAKLTKNKNPVCEVESCETAVPTSDPLMVESAITSDSGGVNSAATVETESLKPESCDGETIVSTSTAT